MDYTEIRALSFADAQQKILVDFNSFDDVFSQYTFLLDFAAKLEPMSEEDRNRSIKVEKCQSDAWVRVEKQDDGTFEVFAESDTLIVRGALKIMVLLLSGRNAKEILESNVCVIENTDLALAFSDERLSGLAAIQKTIKEQIIYLQSKISD